MRHFFRQLPFCILRGFFLMWSNGVFSGGFWEKRVLNVVFLWTRCGELHGKDGFRNTLFGESSFLQIFEVYFRWLF
jgi:hypothetical protein